SHNPMERTAPGTSAIPRSSRVRRLVPVLIAVVLVISLISAKADTTALSFTGGTVLGNAPPFSATWGWAFSLSSSITVTALGAYDPASPDNIGSEFPQQVSIWNS